jgi:hypothetical protein
VDVLGTSPGRVGGRALLGHRGPPVLDRDRGRWGPYSKRLQIDEGRRGEH